jgi:hypothetical protein
MHFLVGYRAYPMSMARFFVAAMRRLGHEVTTVGPYSGDSGAIPWPGNPHFPKYVDRPSIPLPDLSSYPLAALKSSLEKDVDAVFSFDAGFRLTGKLSDVPSVLYGTDPHALDYSRYIAEYDYFFCAQKRLMFGDLPANAPWVPLAYDPIVHVATTKIDALHRPTDVCFIGVMGTGPGSDNAYASRWQAVHLLEGAVKTFSQQGLIFDECTAAYNDAKIAFNFSSSWDIPMRVFEGWGYGCCVVTNRLPHLEEVGFIDGETCVIFDTISELVPRVRKLLDSGDWERIAQRGHAKGIELIATYDTRITQMLTHMRLS